MKTIIIYTQRHNANYDELLRHSRMETPKRFLKRRFGGAGSDQPQAAVMAAIGSSVSRRRRQTSARRSRSAAS